VDIVLALATLGVVQLLAAISPGQSFLFIARTAVAAGRGPALAATLGMALGAAVWAVAAMLGMAVVLQQAAWAYTLLKLAGGLYLLYLGAMLWMHAADPMEIGDSGARRTPLMAALRRGFLVQIANPKVVVFFGSIFFALLPAQAPLWAMVAAVVIVFVNEASWFTTVSLLFSAPRARGTFLRFKTALDRTMAGALGLIGAKLIADAR
jgi:threonine/homoserine/homoserine lactone efflux protein